MTLTSQRIRLRKRLLFCLIIVAVSLVVLELGTRAGVALFRPDIQLADVLSVQGDIAQTTVEDRRNSQPEAIHPFVGFVIDPTDHPTFNEYGFFQVDGPILKRSADTLIVGITGGSVARDICDQSETVLKEQLRAAFPDREPKIVCLAQQGFRQPQQTMTVSFFQCLGAEFDVIVNLDGFNEAVLQPVESPDDELWLAYPRNWSLRVADTSNPHLNRLLYEGYANKTQRKDLAARFQAIRRLPSLALHLIWSLLDRGFRTRQAELIMAIQAEQHRLQNRYANSGPARKFSNTEQRLAAQVELWSASSRQLDRMCQGANTSLIHCLQPNLHVPGSKQQITDGERQRIGSISRYKEAVLEGYDHFAAAGVHLQESGIDFHDLRMLFADNVDDIYSDNCCHFTAYGNDVIAATMARLIVTRQRRSH